MEYVSLRESLINSLPAENEKQEPVNEFLLTLGAIALCSFVAAPLFNTEFFKSVGAGIGGLFGGIGAGINGLFNGRKKDKDKKSSDDRRSNNNDNDDRRSSDNRRTNDNDDNRRSDDKTDVTKMTTKQTNAMMQNMFAVAQEKLDKEKDENEKKKAQSLLDVARACSVDKDGNPVPFEKFGDRLKEVTGMSPEEYKQSIGFKEPTQDEFNKIQEEMKKSLEGKSTEELQKIADENTKKAQDASKKIKEAREANEADQKKLDNAKTELSKLDDNDNSDEAKKKREDLKKQIQDIEKNITDRASAVGLSSGKSDEPKPAEPDKKDEPAEPDKKDEPNKEELRKKLTDRKAELKKQAEDAEKAAKDERSKKSAKDLQKKIDDAMAAAEKAADNNDEKEFDKQMNTIDKLQKARQKQIEAKSVEKDEFGNVIKDEEVTDPETGEKKKVKMHVGPRGGKFYYPNGSPKDQEHRIYVKEDDGSLQSWIYYRSLCLFE